MHIFSSLQPSGADPITAADVERQFAIIVKVDTHIRKADLSVVYANDLVLVEKSINTLEKLLAENYTYKVIGFDLEYTGGHAGHDQMVAVAQLCVCQHVLVYHYCLVTRCCKRFPGLLTAPIAGSPTVDTTNNLKVLKTSGLSYQKLVNIQETTMKVRISPFLRSR
ncbi:hypothetical protein D1007_44872 [Hordeum vulgare]|nr:hypothetical protein D1007_44872 [Hordeum vulgare]